MDKAKRKMMTDLMRVDWLTMQGGKGNQKSSMLLVAAIFLALSFVFSPLLGLYIPMVMGALFVPTLFHNELKYQSGKLFALLPIDRKSLVQARFLMFTGLYILTSTATYLLMLVSLKVKLYRQILRDDAGEGMDVIAVMAKNFRSLSEAGLFTVMYVMVFSVGLGMVTSSLRKYFKDSQRFGNLTLGSMEKNGLRDYIWVGIIVLIIGAIALMLTGYLPVSGLLVLLQVLMQLMNVANGSLLCVAMLLISGFSAAYSYISTVLEYEEKEL